MRDGKFTIKDIEKALDFLKKAGQIYVRVEFDELGRLCMHGSDIGGSAVKITVFDESTQKMAEIQRTERL